MKRIILITIGVLCLILGARFIPSRLSKIDVNEASTGQVVDQTTLTQTTITTGQISTQFQSKTDEISVTEPLMAEEPTSQIIEEIELNSTSVNETAEEQTVSLSEEQSQIESTSELSRIEQKVAENNNTAGKSAGSYVKDSYINQQINDNLDSIDQSDLEAGAAIYNRLDTNYIFTLADGGLTDDERLQLDEYMNSQLTPAEYDLVKNLYFKYVGLLNND